MQLVRREEEGGLERMKIETRRDLTRMANNFILTSSSLALSNYPVSHSCAFVENQWTNENQQDISPLWHAEDVNSHYCFIAQIVVNFEANFRPSVVHRTSRRSLSSVVLVWSSTYCFRHHAARFSSKWEHSFEQETEKLTTTYFR